MADPTAPMVRASRRVLDRPTQLRAVRRGARTVAYEVDGTTFTATFDVDEGVVAGPGGEVRFPIGRVISAPGMRRGAEGTAHGVALGLRRPRHGLANDRRAIEVRLAGQPAGSVHTEGPSTFRWVDVDGTELLDVVADEVRLRSGLAERDVAVGLLLHESRLPATSLRRTYLNLAGSVLHGPGAP